MLFGYLNTEMISMMLKIHLPQNDNGFFRNTSYRFRNLSDVYLRAVINENVAFSAMQILDKKIIEIGKSTTQNKGYYETINHSN